MATIRGEGDTLLLEFVYTCGLIDVGWGGGFGAPPHFEIELWVKHDDLGNDCEEDPREITYDVGPIKQAFRAEHPPPTPLGVRIAPYEEEQGAICLPDVFENAPFRGGRLECE